MLDDRVRHLRQNMTEAEQFVWKRLRSRRFAGYKFRRQMPIGSYIVDFVCLDKRLVVELDGGQHAEQRQYDGRRTAWLTSQGFRVRRYWNHEVFEDWDAIEEDLWNALQGEVK
jgi:very-short-patch-repair endonuclease